MFWWFAGSQDWYYIGANSFRAHNNTDQIRKTHKIVGIRIGRRLRHKKHAQKQTWDTKAVFLACCCESTRSSSFLNNVLALATFCVSLVASPPHQFAKRPSTPWIGRGLLLLLWLESAIALLALRSRNRARLSYMLGVCLKTTFWRFHSMRSSFHKTFISIRNSLHQKNRHIQTHKRHTVLNTPRRMARNSLSLCDYDKEQWQEHWDLGDHHDPRHWPCTNKACTDKGWHSWAWRAPRQLRHSLQVIPGVYSYKSSKILRL